MTKKKRKKKVTTFYIYEGEKTEKIFLEYLVDLYNSEAKPLILFSGRGGSADLIISNAIKAQDRGTYLFVVLDEDFEQKGPISEETLRSLERVWCLPQMELDGVPYRELNNHNTGNRKPVIIFSNPSSIEGMLLQILGVSKDDLEGKETDRLKDRLNSYCQSGFDQSFLKERFPKDVIEEKRKIIPELNLILSLLEKVPKV